MGRELAGTGASDLDRCSRAKCPVSASPPSSATCQRAPSATDAFTELSASKSSWASKCARRLAVRLRSRRCSRAARATTAASTSPSGKAFSPRSITCASRSGESASKSFSNRFGAVLGTSLPAADASFNAASSRRVATRSRCTRPRFARFAVAASSEASRCDCVSMAFAMAARAGPSATRAGMASRKHEPAPAKVHASAAELRIFRVFSRGGARARCAPDAPARPFSPARLPYCGISLRGDPCVCPPAGRRGRPSLLRPGTRQ